MQPHCLCSPCVYLYALFVLSLVGALSPYICVCHTSLSLILYLGLSISVTQSLVDSSSCFIYICHTIFRCIFSSVFVPCSCCLSFPCLHVCFSTINNHVYLVFLVFFSIIQSLIAALFQDVIVTPSFIVSLPHYVTVLPSLIVSLSHWMLPCLYIT